MLSAQNAYPFANPSSTGVPVYRLDDTRIANDTADLWDGILQAVPFTDESGILSRGTTGTGTSASGTARFPLDGNCVQIGGFDSNDVGGMFDSGPGAGCLFSNTGRQFRFYGMSGELTVEPMFAADFDNDGDVDGDDLTDPIDGWEVRYGDDLHGASFLNWQREFTESGSSELSASVPEPAGCVLALIAVAVARNRRSH